ncbi:hypothetical protein KC19_6G213800 [Ceratodon purpureus]|uniref:Uncharacterized protein n=1 Tax=Ceratodon purpureus TaxID=3225 RepID=A0A8T0HK24_CERPU|nr:hypothetical protein KC19_6G213800 [Ceratodon purpureus]
MLPIQTQILTREIFHVWLVFEYEQETQRREVSELSRNWSGSLIPFARPLCTSVQAAYPCNQSRHPFLHFISTISHPSSTPRSAILLAIRWWKRNHAPHVL